MRSLEEALGLESFRPNSAATPDDLKAYLLERANFHGVDPRLAASIFEQESSGGRNTSTSAAGARGPMQVMPATFRQMYPEGNIDDPRHNIEAGVRYLKHGKDILGTDDPRLLAAGYYQGYNRDSLKRGEIVNTNIDPRFPSVQQYSDEVSGRLPGGRPRMKSLEEALGLEGTSVFPLHRDGETSASPKKALERDAFAYANDFMIDAGNAVAGLAKAGVDLFAPGGDASQSIDAFIKQGQASQSDWKKASREKLNEQLRAAPNEWSKAGAYLIHAVVDDPLGLVAEAAGNIGPFAAFGKVLQAARIAEPMAEKIAMGLASTLAVGEVRGNIYDKIQATPDAELQRVNPDYARARQTMTEAQAKKEFGTQFVQHLPELALTAVVGALGGKYGLEALAVGVGPKVGRAGRAVIGTVDEGGQGAVEQLATNVGVGRVDPRQTLGEDVPLNAAMEGLIGGVGGALSGSQGQQAPAPRPQPQPGQTAAPGAQPPGSVPPTAPSAAPAADAGHGGGIPSNAEDLLPGNAAAPAPQPQPNAWTEKGVEYRVVPVDEMLWHKYIRPDSKAQVDSFEEYRQRYPTITHMRLKSSDGGATWKPSRAPFIGTEEKLLASRPPETPIMEAPEEVPKSPVAPDVNAIAPDVDANAVAPAPSPEQRPATPEAESQAPVAASGESQGDAGVAPGQAAEAPESSSGQISETDEKKPPKPTKPTTGQVDNVFRPGGLKPGTPEYEAAFDAWSTDQQERRDKAEKDRLRAENETAAQKRNGWRNRFKEWFLGASAGDTFTDSGTGGVWKVVEKVRKNGTKTKSLLGVDQNGEANGATGISVVGDRVEGLHDGSLDENGFPNPETSAQSLAVSLGILMESGEGVTTSAAATSEPTSSDVDASAHQAATSPHNDLPEPTEPQKEAGNYQKGHVRIAGLDISIENPQGSKRSGTDRDGKAWESEMQHHYGYIRDTVGRDKDHIDVFVKPGTPEDFDGPVFIVDQADPKTKDFDEHKVMLGFDSLQEAKAAYRANYAQGWRGMQSISTLPLAEFKTWLKDGDTTKPLVPVSRPKPPEPPAENAERKALHENLTARLNVLADRAREAGDTNLYSNLANFMIGVSPTDTMLTPEWVEEVVKARIELVKAAERKSAEATRVKRQEARRFLENELFTLLKSDETLVEAAKKGRSEFNLEAAQTAKSWMQAELTKAKDAGETYRAYALEFMGALPEEFFPSLFKEIQARLPKAEPKRKLENTGEDLRRWYEQQKAAPEKEEFVKRIEKSTVRGELLNPQWGESPTPGLGRWFDALRDRVQGFRNFFKEQWRETQRWYHDENDDEVIARAAKELPDFLMDTAQRYIDTLTSLSTALSGASNVKAAADKFEAWIKDGDNVERYREVRTGNISYGEFTNRGYFTSRTIATESEPSKTAQPLTRPRLDSVEREGLANTARGDGNVTPAQMKSAFGFADVGFGNWVAAGRDQLHLNYAFDAFADLAHFLDAPGTGIGLGGNLHFTVGALGSGKFAAHYHDAHPGPDGKTVRVINVTNTRGDGTVAHEWGHALDFHLRREPQGAAVMRMIVRTLSLNFNTNEARSRAISALRGNIFMKGAKRVAKSDPLANARAVLDYYRDHPGRFGSTSFKRQADDLGKDYWGNDAELFARAWEAWVYDNLGGRSDYLVTGWVGDGVTTKATGYRGTPYPEGAERKRFNAMFDALREHLEWTDSGPVIRDFEKLQEKIDPDTAWRMMIGSLQIELPELLDQMRREEESAKQPKTPPPKPEPEVKPEDQEPAIEEKEPPPPGALSEDDLSRLFDEAAAELKEQKQEEPEAPPKKSDSRKDGNPPERPAAQAPAPSQSATELIAEAAKLGVTGINEALSGLADLFGGNKLKSFPGGFDPDTYAKAKPHFEAALKAFQDAGKTLKDLFKLLIEKFGEGVKPYAIQFAKDQGLGSNLGETKKVSAEMQIARRVSTWLKNDNPALPITDKLLFGWASEAFGGTLAEGRFEAKDAYDAVELGVNLYIRDHFLEGVMGHPPDVARTLTTILGDLVKRLPTQTRRSDEMIAFQQFSTPPAYAYVANWVANITRNDVYMEPSAGTGSLAVWGSVAGALVRPNELSQRRAAILRELFGERSVTTENADHLAAVFADWQAKPTVVVMNPPFSATAGRTDKRDTSVGANHVEQALKLLAPGGRVVAIVGRGMTLDAPTFRDWWQKIRATYNVRANVGVGGKDYAKYGTSFETRLLVIDKTGPTMGEVLTASVESVGELPALLGDIRADRQETDRRGSETQQASDQPGGGETAADGLDQSGAPARTGAGEVGDGAGSGAAASEEQGGGASGKPGSGGARSGNGKAGSRTGGKSESGDDAPGRGGRDPGSARNDGEREQSDVTLQQQTTVDEGALTDAVFESYRPQRLKIEGARAHPGELVQSAAMAAMMPPTVTYTPNLPKSVIEMKGGIGLSEAQLEAVVYAGQSFQEFMPNGTRRGFFIGDGTGVGKGREIAGILLDHMRQGIKKHVWVSEKSGLMRDAKRDMKGVGGDENLILKLPSDSDERIRESQGVLFTTYATLRKGFVDPSASGGDQGSTPRQGGKKLADKKRQRIEQIKEWLGPDFAGVIVFDEAHNMRGAIDTPGKRGKKKASLTGLVGIELQKALPKARIVYVSATGATEVSNLSYAMRLGLWGEGTPFPAVSDFVNKIGQAGLSAMEIVAQSMKAAGMYISRSLSYLGINYNRVEHELTPLQRQMYDEMAAAWRVVMKNIDDALAATEQDKNGQAKASARAQFWGSQLRFFNQVITAMQMPSALQSMREDIEAGHSVVLQLVNTNEAAQERAVAKAKEEGAEEIEDLDLTPRQILIDYLQRSFPVQQYETKINEEGSEISVPVTDSKGNPVLNPEAVAMRDKMVRNLEQIRMPDNPIDLVLAEFGSDAVAEITGRSRRFVRKIGKNGEVKLEEQAMGERFREIDAEAFQNDDKRILIFSDAGGTGFSFQADLSKKNQRLRRHYLIQPGWRADKAVQGFGRTHRTNQKQPPEYVLVLTDVPGHKRFVSSIARRLDQLGALTKGSREAKGSELFDATDNLESKYATLAVDALLADMYYESIPNGRKFLEDMGLNDMMEHLENNEKKWPPPKVPEVTQFINRVLILDLETQRAVFDEFMTRLSSQVDFAKQKGTYDEGLQTIRALGAKALREKVVYSEPKSGATTNYIEVELTQETKFYDFEVVAETAQKSENFVGFYRNLSQDKLYAVTKSGSRTDADGTVHNTVRMVGPSVQRYATQPDFGRTVRNKETGALTKTWEKIESVDEARKLWEQEEERTPKTYAETAHFVYGAIMPLWDRLPTQVNVARMKLDDGRRILGRIIRDDDLETTLERLGVGSKVAEMKPEELWAELGKGNSLVLSNGWVIKPVRVAGDTRYEISASYFSGPDLRILVDQGAFSETHNWKQRVYLPTDDLQVFKRITAAKPVVRIGETEAKKKLAAQDPDFSRSDRRTAPSRPSRVMRVRDVEAAIAPIRAVGKGLPTIHVVQHVSDLPRDLARSIRGDGSIVRGAFYRGQIYLIASNLSTPRESVFTMLHEAAHFGLQSIFGPEIDAVLMKMYREHETVRRAADRRRAKYPSLSQVKATEEVLADWAGKNVEPTLLQRLVAWVRDWFRRRGVQLEMTNADVLAIIARARTAWQRPSSAQWTHVYAAPRQSQRAPLRQQVAQLVDPATLTFREEQQHRLDEVRERFPEGEAYSPIVTVRDGPEREILDGHNRAAVAQERGDRIPVVDISRNAYEALSAAGFDDIEIAFAALVDADEADAAYSLNAQFPGAGVSTRGLRALELLDSFNPANQSAYSRSGESSEADFAASTLSLLSDIEDLYQQPKSDKKTVTEIAAEIDPGIKVQEIGSTAWNLEGTAFLTMPDGKMTMIRTYKDGAVDLDASVLEEGQSRGSAAYNVAATFAHNTGRLFIGDPAGLTDAGLFRRTENMISSAMKFETTDHLYPHERQIAEGLQWEDGKDNLANLLKFSRDLLAREMPEAADLVYDFETQEYRNERTGENLDEAAFRDLARDSRGARAARAGYSTLKRAALLNTLVRTTGPEARTRILGQVVRQLREGLDPDLVGIFYSRKSPPGSRPAQPAPNTPQAPLNAGLDASGLRETARKFLDRTRMELDPFAFLPDRKALETTRYQLLGRIARFDEIAADIKTIFSTATEEDQQAAYRYFLTPEADKGMIPNPSVAAMAERTKALIESVGDALVARGAMTPEVREAHRGRYLPQVYLKFLLGDQNWRALGAGKKISDRGYLKQRKLDRRVGDDGEVHVYDAQTGEVLDQEFLDAVLGPVEDPGYLSSLAIVRPLRDMAILDYLAAIAENAQWVLPKSVIEWRGKRVSAHWAKTEAERLRRQARHQDPHDAANARKIAEELDVLADEALGEIEGEHADYRQIPNTARYGRLRGIWVRKEIYDDLMGVNDFLPADPGFAMSLLGYGGIGTRITSLWKAGKVSLNPPAQVRNFVSNMVLLQLSGVPLRRIPSLFVRALRQVMLYNEYRRGGGRVLSPEERHRVRHYLVALKYGVTESTFNAQELYRMQRDLLEIERASGLLNTWGKIKLAIGAVMDYASDKYQLTEVLGKTMKIMDEMERGRPEHEAALAAQEALFDYSLVSKNVRYLRNAPMGMPFVTFAIKVAPVLLKTARHHPERFLPWIALAYGLPALLAAAFDVDDDDIEALKKALPEWLQDRGHAYVLPWKDDTGRWQVIDLGYFFPWTTWTEPMRLAADGEAGKTVQALGLFSGPLTDLITAVMTGRDSFTGREIVAPGDPPKRQLLQIVNYLWTMAMPPIITEHGAAGHAIRAATGQTDRFGDPLSTGGQAALRAVGVNIYPIHPETSRTANIRRMMREIGDTEYALRKRLQDRGLSDERKASLVQEYIAEVDRRREKLMDYIADSEVHPNLATEPVQ